MSNNSIGKMIFGTPKSWLLLAPVIVGTYLYTETYGNPFLPGDKQGQDKFSIIERDEWNQAVLDKQKKAKAQLKKEAAALQELKKASVETVDRKYESDTNIKRGIQKTKDLGKGKI